MACLIADFDKLNCHAGAANILFWLQSSADFLSMANERLGLLRNIIAERIVLLDGATGTSIKDMRLGPEDFGGAKLEGCNENLVRSQPNRIRELHRSFLQAGADIIETNSFGGTSIALAHYGLKHDVREINRLAAQLAREEAAAASTPLARASWRARSVP